MVLCESSIWQFFYTLYEAETRAHTGFVGKSKSGPKVLKYISRKKIVFINVVVQIASLVTHTKLDQISYLATDTTNYEVPKTVTKFGTETIDRRPVVLPCWNDLILILFKEWRKNLFNVPFWTYYVRNEYGSHYSCCTENTPYSNFSVI